MIREAIKVYVKKALEMERMKKKMDELKAELNGSTTDSEMDVTANPGFFDRYEELKKIQVQQRELMDETAPSMQELFEFFNDNPKIDCLYYYEYGNTLPHYRIRLGRSSERMKTLSMETVGRK